MRKGILPVIAGKPAADSAQPFGMNGMRVTVMMKVTTEPAVAFASVFIVVILSLVLIVQSLTRLRGSRCRCRCSSFGLSNDCGVNVFPGNESLNVSLSRLYALTSQIEVSRE